MNLQQRPLHLTSQLLTAIPSAAESCAAVAVSAPAAAGAATAALAAAAAAAAWALGPLLAEGLNPAAAGGRTAPALHACAEKGSCSFTGDTVGPGGSRPPISAACVRGVSGA